MFYFSFEGGQRSADIITVGNSVLAVLTFLELESLVERDAALQRKLMKMFAQVSIRKLRKQMQGNQAPQNKTPQPQQKGPVVKESLYKARLALQSKTATKEAEAEKVKVKKHNRQNFSFPSI